MTSKQPGVRETLRLFSHFFRHYPGPTIHVLVLLFLAFLFEGVGVVSLLPILGIASGESGFGDSGIGARILGVFAYLGLPPTLPVLLLLMVGGITIKAILSLLATQQSGYLATRIASDQRQQLIRSIFTARWSFIVRQKVGAITNAYGSEAERSSAAFTACTQLLSILLQVGLYGLLSLWVSWQGTLAALLFGAVLFRLLDSFLEIGRRASREYAVLLKEISADLSDGVASLKPLKAMGRLELLSRLLIDDTSRLDGLRRREIMSFATLLSVQEPLISLFLAVGLYVSLVHLRIPMSELFFIAILFYRTITRVGGVQGAYQQIVRMEPYFWSILETISQAHAEAEPLTGAEHPEFTRAISLRDVTFGYGERPILARVSLTIPVGSLTAFRGGSGAGKTTIADLIVGLHRPQEGDVFLDETPLSRVDPLWWRNRIGYVPQEMVLFHDTIFSNLTMGDPQLTRADAERALEMAEALDFVRDLPEGLDTVVGERGSCLSGGQRQRISLARALIYKPNLLILDEVTSALDPATEQAICLTLRKLAGQVTMLAISHQSALLDIADHVYQVEAGQAVATGAGDAHGR